MTAPDFRLATPADRGRILEIASHIWEGEDYIPDVIDDWLAPGTAQLVVALIDGVVTAFARYDRSVPGYAWFEGLRTHPDYQNRGLGKAVTAHLIERARADGADRIGLSTYSENIASQRVSSAFGFRPAATFAYLSAETPAVLPRAAPGSRTEPVASQEALAFIAASDALRLGRGFLPHSWRFYPLARGPEIALGHMEHILGIRRGGRLAALLCLGDRTPHGHTSFSIDFLDGEREDVAELAQHALTFAGSSRYVEAMVPRSGATVTVAHDVLRGLDLGAWEEGAEDVIVYELNL